MEAWARAAVMPQESSLSGGQRSLTTRRTYCSEHTSATLRCVRVYKEGARRTASKHADVVVGARLTVGTRGEHVHVAVAGERELATPRVRSARAAAQQAILVQHL